MDQLESIDSGTTKPKKMTKQYKQQNQSKIHQQNQKEFQSPKEVQYLMNDRPKREIKKTSPFDNSDCLLNSSPVT